jgi:hypothetical protein
MPQVFNVSMLGAPIRCRSWRCSTVGPARRAAAGSEHHGFNVPGPRETLCAAGAELLHIFPVSISTHGIALNITVQSYRDQPDFGFIAGANIIFMQVLCDMLLNSTRRGVRAAARREEQRAE